MIFRLLSCKQRWQDFRPDRLTVKAGMALSRGTLAANQVARLHAMHTMPALGGKPSGRLCLCALSSVSRALWREERRAGRRELQLRGPRSCDLLRRSRDGGARKAPQASPYMSAGPDAGPQKGRKPEWRAPRRALLAGSALLGCLAACSDPRVAAALGVTPDQAAAALRAANVVPTLPPSGYLRLIAISRPTAERTVAAQVRTFVVPPLHVTAFEAAACELIAVLEGA